MSDETTTNFNSQTASKSKSTMINDEILKISFNQDCTSLAVGKVNSYCFFSVASQTNGTELNEIQPVLDTINLPYQDIFLIERLFSSSLTVLASAQAPRTLRICHMKKGSEITSYVFPDDIKAVKLNRERMIVCLETSIHIYYTTSMKPIFVIADLSSNPEGLCALSSDEKNPYLAYRVTSTEGQLQIFDTKTLIKTKTIVAHTSSLSAMEFDRSGTRLATASIKGTVVRVFNVIDGSLLVEFRRGLCRNATIFSLAFSPDSMFVAASSNTETIHVFRLYDEKEKSAERQVGWMETIGNAMSGVSRFIPGNPAEIFSQDRAFATIHHQQYNKKSVLAMNASNKLLKLYAAFYDGTVRIYEIDLNQGGECKQIVEQHLFQRIESQSQQPINDHQENLSTNQSRLIYPPNELTPNEELLTIHSSAHQSDDQYTTASSDENFDQTVPSSEENITS